MSTMSGLPASSCITSVFTTSCSGTPSDSRRDRGAAVLDVLVRVLGERDAVRLQERRRRRFIRADGAWRAAAFRRSRATCV